MPHKKRLAKRKPNSHKGDYGHVFILAGSLGLTGAAYLTSTASLLSGSGLVTLGIPKSLNLAMEVKLTEVMTKPLDETKELSLSLKAFGQIKKFLSRVDVLAIGPGLSQHPQTQALVRKVLQSTKKPIVLDADGINALAGNLSILKKIKGQLVITPHPGELSRLLGLEVAEIQKNRIKLAKAFAKKYNVVTVLKGHRTIVASANGTTYINKTGNPGMASGGCGDVLTGIIASLLGQGMSAPEAAKFGVYIHGLMADVVAKEKGESSLIATDLLKVLPQVLKKLSEK